jgi:hypothetical protein
MRTRRHLLNPPNLTRLSVLVDVGEAEPMRVELSTRDCNPISAEGLEALRVVARAVRIQELAKIIMTEHAPALTYLSDR